MINLQNLIETILQVNKYFMDENTSYQYETCMHQAEDLFHYITTNNLLNYMKDDIAINQIEPQQPYVNSPQLQNKLDASMHALQGILANKQQIYDDKHIETITKLAVKYGNALIDELQKNFP